jgi:hypothetical protein
MIEPSFMAYCEGISTPKKLKTYECALKDAERLARICKKHGLTKEIYVLRIAQKVIIE